MNCPRKNLHRSRKSYLQIRLVVILILSALFVSITNAESKVVVEVESDQTNAIVKVLADQRLFEFENPVVVTANGTEIAAQISQPGIEHPNATKESIQVTFVAPELLAQQENVFSIRSAANVQSPVFAWHDDQSTMAELQMGDRPVLKYMYEELDDATEKRRQQTYKVYHHVFSPDGKCLLTKGPGGLFPHHRGIFFAYNRIKYGDQKADVWHCKKKACQSHAGSVEREAGAVFGRDQNIVLWKGADGKPFAKELRQVSAYQIEKGTLLEFHSRLTPLVPSIALRGDPQHAGVQFRASQKVASETKNKTFYVRPDGKGVPGEFRNWSNKKNESETNRNHIDLSWNTMCFRIEDRLYSCCYMNHPNNPKPTRFSERDYGRFGSYFEYDLTPDNPLLVRYRFWVGEGELSVNDAQIMDLDFVSPKKITFKHGAG